MKLKLVFISAFVLFFLIHGNSQQITIPKLVSNHDTKQLIVDGKPFLMLSGELRNSSSTDKAHMDSTWAQLKAMNLNTVIATLSWQLVEPEEGKFDLHWVDDLVMGARQHDLKLVLIWFASYKNSFSTYVPDWVKKDMKRFPICIRKDGTQINRLSEFYETSMKADARAFVKVMERIKEIDSEENTVLMMQVQNETGMLTDSKDYTMHAEKAFKKDVPQELLKYLNENKANIHPYILSHWQKNDLSQGNWEEVFGKSPITDEIFMAWHLAKYVGYITQSGKEVYNIPMFVNAWLARDSEPGKYPTGGPVARLMDIWKAASPQIDFYAPDIYVPEFKEVCADYHRNGNPLFFPESSRKANNGLRAFYVVAEHNGLGLAPFAVDDPDHIGNSAVTGAYKTLDQLMPIIAEYQGTGKMRGFIYSDQEEETIVMGNTNFTIKYWLDDLRDFEGGGLIIQTGENEFIAAGSGVTIMLSSTDEKRTNVNLLTVEEGYFKNGEWVTTIYLNGDEIYPGINLPYLKTTTERCAYNRFSIQKFSYVSY